MDARYTLHDRMAQAGIRAGTIFCLDDGREISADWFDANETLTTLTAWAGRSPRTEFEITSVVAIRTAEGLPVDLACVTDPI